MIKKHGSWELVRGKNALTDPSLNDIFFVSEDLDL